MYQLSRFMLCLLVAGTFFSGCKKKVENIQQDLLVDLIVSSPWVITTYRQGTSDVTAEFNGYRFQFRRNFTVDAVRGAVVEKTGTWNGDITTKTIVSNFENPSPMLARLNGTWLVKDSGLDFVESTQTINNQLCFLRLDKE